MFEQPVSVLEGGAGLPMRALLACVALLALTFGARPGRAQEDLYRSLNLAERRSVDRVLEELGLERDETPEGKRFGALVVVNQPVFLDDIPSLTWLNALHITTRPQVVRQEVLWRTGDPYDGELVWETVRNLRQRNTLSVVAMIPVKSGEPDRLVDILVVTRDTWSLRLGFQLEMTDEVIDHLQVSLTEWNLLGRHKLVSLTGVWEQDTLRIGPTYVDPRLFGTRAALWEGYGLVVNHDTGEVEGSTNLLELQLPLYRRDARWGMRYLEQHDIGIDRLFLGSSLRTYDNPDTTTVEAIPFEIEQKELDVLAEGVASVGRLNKHLFSLGYGLSVREYDLLERTVDMATSEAFQRDVLPVSEFASFIALGYRFYRTEYTSLTNYQTYGFSEDIRLGHDVTLIGRVGSRALGSDRDFIRASLLAGYGISAGDLVLQAEFEIGGRLELQGSELDDRFLRGTLHLAAPWWGPVRLHAGGEGLVRFHRVYAGLQSVGGGEGLRGFPGGAFLGESAMVGHLELRTRPVELLTVFMGLVAFFDAGSVFDEGESLDLLCDVGIGVRAVIPQLQRIPWRLDYAFPLAGPYATFPGVLTVGTLQVF